MNNNILNKNERRVLASLYHIKEGSINKVAKDTLINRTTLYPILDKLTEKGLVSKIKTEGKTYFQPISKEDFILWTKRREVEIKKENTALLDWVDKESKEKKVTLVSEIKYFEGIEGVKSLYADSWRDNNGKIIYAITDYKNAYDTLGDFFHDDYFQQRIKHGIKVKNLLPESEEGKQDIKDALKLLREMKFIKIFQDLSIEINIYDSKVSIVAFDKKNPSGILIKNEKIASALKNIFEYIWKVSK